MCKTKVIIWGGRYVNKKVGKTEKLGGKVKLFTFFI